MNLFERQVELEQQMVERGAARYVKAVLNARGKGMEQETDYAQRIMGEKVVPLSQAIDEWKATLLAGRANYRGIAFKLIGEMDSKVLAFLTLRAVLAHISTEATYQQVTTQIGMACEDELRLASIRAEERKAYERIMQGVEKRVSEHHRRYYMVRSARMVDNWEEWGQQNRLQVGASLLEILMSTLSLVEKVVQKTSKTYSKTIIKATPETREWIEKRIEVAQFFRPTYEPMVVPPKPWTTPFDGGYLTSSIRPLSLVKVVRVGKEYLNQLAEVEMPTVYAAVNAIQNTAWAINTKVLDVMEALWENSAELDCMPPRDGLPVPPKPHDIDENEEARKEWRRAAAKVYEMNKSLTSKRIGFAYTIANAKTYSEFPELYFPYQLDFRGRIYAVPHLNPQGSDNVKGLLHFANGKRLGKDGAKWLAFHGCNLSGNDKVSIDDRVQWVQDNEQEILAIAADPFNNLGWTKAVGGQEIDSPWQFLAFCFEWAGYKEQGEDFVSHLPVAFDGSCSGIQHYSAMLRDSSGGAAVNLTPSALPQDVYKKVADRVQALVEFDLKNGTEDENELATDAVTGEVSEYTREGTKTLAAQWLKHGITRKVTKRPVMTLAYGAKLFGYRDQLMEDILKPLKTSAMLPDGTMSSQWMFSGDGYAAAGYMASKIWEAVNQVLVAAGEAMAWLQRAASLLGKEGLPVRWTSSVGFPVLQVYYDETLKNVRTSLYGKSYMTSLRDVKDTINTRKQTSSIAPNFVHSMDAGHLMLTVENCVKAGLTSFSMIHDSFGTLAGDSETMYRIVRESFVEIYDQRDILGEFREEILEQLSEESAKKLPELPSKGDLDVSAIMQSKYAFS